MAKKSAKKPDPVIAKRLTRCRRSMKKHRMSAYLVTSRMDGFYLTGFTGEDSAVLVMPRDVHIISDGRFDEAINQECPWVTRWMRRGLLTAEIANVAKKLKIKSLAIQPAHMSVADRDAIRRNCRSTRLVDAKPIAAEMRELKDDAELSKIRKAIRIAQDAFAATCESIRVGQTELEMAARLEYEMKVRGASGPSFPTICAEGPNAALPHAHPGSRKVKNGSAVLFDWGARVGNYCSDLTRVVFVGSIHDKIGEVYRIVLEAQRRAIAGIRPGERMCDVDDLARQYIADAGYREAFNHGLGHGLGLEVHEAPSLSWRSNAKLQAGMVVTVEPGIYLPGVGGVRIEDDVLVTPKGHRMLSRVKKRLEDVVLPARQG